MGIGQEPKFNVIKEEQVTIDNWNPRAGGYATVGEALEEVRDFNPRLHQELTTVRADREKGGYAFRFYAPHDGGYGVLIFKRNSEGKYEPLKLMPHLAVVLDGKELDGIEAAADYYSANLEEIIK